MKFPPGWGQSEIEHEVQHRAVAVAADFDEIALVDEPQHRGDGVLGAGAVTLALGLNDQPRLRLFVFDLVERLCLRCLRQ